MKHYKINNDQLIFKDSKGFVLYLPLIAVVLSGMSCTMQLVGRTPLEFDILTILLIVCLMACVTVLIWASVKKTYVDQVALDQITSVNQSSMNSSVYYLTLKNGRQRSLIKITNKNQAVELLELLRENHKEIKANFDELSTL